MSPSVVLNAERPGNNSATGMAKALSGRGKCILLYVPIVAKTRRYLSSPDRIDRCIAASATPKSGFRLRVKKGNTKGEGTVMVPSSLIHGQSPIGKIVYLEPCALVVRVACSVGSPAWSTA